MIIGEDRFVMLLAEKFFKTFTKEAICDATKSTEAIIALSADSREKVDEMMNKVIEAGGIESRDFEDNGWMYGRSFQDIDGHLWEIGFMEESAVN
jgi:predicted lactoylglutathione lyase